MAGISEFKENPEEDKVNLNEAISSLKKFVTGIRIEKRSDWKSFKNKFNDDMDNIQQLIYHRDSSL